MRIFKMSEALFNDLIRQSAVSALETGELPEGDAPEELIQLLVENAGMQVEGSKDVNGNS
jgi:hypothetical protein